VHAGVFVEAGGPAAKAEDLFIVVAGSDIEPSGLSAARVAAPVAAFENVRSTLPDVSSTSRVVSPVDSRSVPENAARASACYAPVVEWRKSPGLRFYRFRQTRGSYEPERARALA
jgi:hypothetical protein